MLEKYAVRAGGATNHRVGLFDAILIKDNHIRIAGGVKAAISAARARQPGLAIEVEAETLAQVDEALAAGAEVILVDNMDKPGHSRGRPAGRGTRQDRDLRKRHGRPSAGPLDDGRGFRVGGRAHAFRASHRHQL